MTERCVKNGYDFIEIQSVNGFLIHEFLYPLTNHHTDEYCKRYMCINNKRYAFICLI